MARVCLDPGHGGRNQNIGLGGYRESDFALAVALEAQKYLRAAGVEVVLTRRGDYDLCNPEDSWSEVTDLQSRCAIANNAKADLYVSIHSNAAGNPDAHGTETYCYQTGSKAEVLAQAIQRRLVQALGTYDRGVKTANFYVLRNTTMPAALTEMAFHTNPDDVAILRDPDQQKVAAKAIADAVLEVLGPVAWNAPGEAIIGLPRIPVGQAQAWAKSRGATQWFIDLAPLYWELASKRGGVKPEVAYAQAAKETRFGNFGGVIPGPEWHNPCGFKTKSGGANDDPNAHARFPDDRTGVMAHLDHLALYAGAVGYPKANTPDPRHFPSIEGKAQTVEALGGHWAPSADYGASIVRDYLTPMLNFKQEADLAALKAELERVKKERDEYKRRLVQIRELTDIWKGV